MAFLAIAATGRARIDPELLRNAAGISSIVWFSANDPGLGGVVCRSSLADVAFLKEGDRLDCVLVGRVRLDRREELRASLACGRVPDAELCLRAYAQWGEGALEHIHGDFAFVIRDNAKHELLCARDRFGIRTLTWFQREEIYWIAGSMQDLVTAPGVDVEELDPSWIADFLRVGVCADPSRSAYARIHRLSPGHFLKAISRHASIQRYWSLQVDPIVSGSAASLAEQFHASLNEAMQDCLPPGPVGIFMSGGLDSATLAAKALEVGQRPDRIAARTWLAGGDVDPEAQASQLVARHLGVQQTMVDADQFRFEPLWREKATVEPEPNMKAIFPSARIGEARAMRSQAAVWLYGEGPDNALTFEWRMYLRWLVRNNRWGDLPGVAASYLRTKSLKDWITTARSYCRSSTDSIASNLEPTWVRGPQAVDDSTPVSDWRPRAHRNLRSSLWPNMFENLDAEYAEFGIEWRHPYMNLRVIEFLLSTPPIPWARHKMLIRHAMRGRLPEQILRRPKTPLHRDVLDERLQLHLPDLLKTGRSIEPFIDTEKLPRDTSDPAVSYAIARIAILDHWLTARHG